MKKLLILLPLLFLLLPGFAQERNSTRVFNTLADLDAAKPSKNSPYAKVLGIVSPGDWGPAREFRWDSTNALATNAVRRATVTGIGRWVHDWGGDARAFGVVGDEVTDDTAAIQAALDYALPNRIVTRLPAKSMVVNSLRMGHQALVGAWSARQSFGGVYGGGTHLIHKEGATNHMIRVLADGSANRGVLLENLNLQGRGHFNAQNKRTILSSTNRLEFFVATNDLPVNGGVTTAWPYFGQVFFYTSESKYAGHSVVSNINYTTGAVTLLSGWDQYATLSSTDYLSAGWFAVFSPSVSAYDDTGNVRTVIDPSSAGWCGISIESTTNIAGAVTAVFLPKLNNVFTRGFHVGVRSGIGIAVHTDGLWCSGNQFAGVCAPFGGYSYDWNMSQTFLQGFYSDWNANTHPETLTLKNRAYRYSAFGCYGLDTTGMLGDLTLDHNVNGGYFPHGADTHISSLLVDGSIGYGLVFNSSRLGSRVHYSMPSVTIRTWTNYDMDNFGVPQLPGLKRYAIYAMGNNGAVFPPVVHMGLLNLTRAGDATNDYSALFHSDITTAKFQLRGLWQTNGVSLLNSTNTLVQYTTGLEVDAIAPSKGLIWNGTNGSYVTAATTNVSIGTNDFTVWVKARLPETPAPITISSLFALSTSSSSGAGGGGLYSGFISTGDLYTTLNGATSSDGRTAKVAGLFSELAGKVVDIVWRRNSGALTVMVNGRNRFYAESTFGTPPANFAQGITNTYAVVGRGDKSWSDRIYRFAWWNRYVTDSEMASVLLYGIPVSDRWGNSSRTGCVQDLNLGIGSGTSIPDRSANAFNGTLTGTNVFHLE